MRSPLTFPTRLRAVSALTALFSLGIAASTHAAEDADTLLAKAEAGLQAAQSLSAGFTVSTLHPTRYSDTQERGTILLAKPDKTRVEITRYRKPVDADRWIASGNGSTLVADGQQTHTLVRHPQSAQVRTVNTPPNAAAKAPGGLDPLRGFFAVSQAGAENWLLGVQHWEKAEYTVIEQTPADRERSGGRTAEREEKREIYIGADGLIHREVIHLIVEGKPVVREIALHDLRLDPTLRPDAFTFTPPAEATPVTPLAPQPLLAVGTVAPDFQVEDAEGRAVHLAEFRGKVVLLKFFATWCWTCKESLPGTNALAGRYANQDVVVLAVDIWNSRKAFRAWTAKTPYHAIRFTHDPRPQGTDIASALYHVTTTPTEFVINRDGKIVAVSTGYEGPDARLEQTIAALLPARPTSQVSARAEGTAFSPVNR